MYIFRF